MAERKLDDGQVAAFTEALEIANVPVLLCVLVMLTGDERWMADPYRPERNRGLDDHPDGGLAPEIQREIRAAALQAILAWRAGRPVAIPEPSDELLARILSNAMGEPVPVDYGPFLAVELGLDRVADRHEPLPSIPEDFRVLVVGAGVSGLAMAIGLQAAGIPFDVIEKADTVGGTWRENSYPGAGVDTPSSLYAFSFAPHDWTWFFALRDELQGYLEEVSRRPGIRERIRFGTELTAAEWSDAEQRWTVTLRDATGAETVEHAPVVVTAVGGLHRPKLPDLPGLDEVDGPVVHTARWPADLDLTGKRVGVIGSGASSMQVVPAIAERVESLTVFQRQAQWAAPFDQFQRPVPEPLRFLNREVPLYRLWYRLRSGWTFNDRIYDALQKDPEWEHPERAVSAANDGHRRVFTRYIESELEGRPDLIAASTPTYPPFGKRILLDNGWYRTLRRDNVELVTERVERGLPEGLRTADGRTHELDVVVCATGFDAARYLAPIDVVGRTGETLRDTWDDDDARAFLGMTVPDFPNLFIVYGPNTQAGHGGTLINAAEVQVHHIVALIEHMLSREIGSVECRRDRYEAYGRRVDEIHENMIWTHPGMSTYYRNSRGRVTVATPFRVIDYWTMAREPDLDDYIIEPARAPAPARL
jgi:4-hydroxyacetophenone monooxygenase